MFAFTDRRTSAQGDRTTVLSQRHCRACQTVLLRMVVQRSFETVTRAQEPAQSYAPPASAASAFTLLTSRVCAAPDVLLLVFFSSVAAERKAFLVTRKQAYTFVSYAFLSMLEKQRSQRRRHVKPHPQQLRDVSRSGQGRGTWNDGFTFCILMSDTATSRLQLCRRTISDASTRRRQASTRKRWQSNGTFKRMAPRHFTSSI